MAGDDLNTHRRPHLAAQMSGYIMMLVDVNWFLLWAGVFGLPKYAQISHEDLSDRRLLDDVTAEI